MGIFQKIRDGLKKTRDSVIKGMRRMLGSFTKIDEELFEQLEETMIMGDMGADTAIQICDQLRDMVKERGITNPNDIMGLIQEITTGMLGADEGLDLSTTPSVILVIGVNGAGKTTTIGKLCHQFKNDGKRVLVAAADTFRAAAIDQLQIWTDRSETELVRHAEGSDPAAVVFDAITAAKARGCDVVICDTAGRLHNKKNLMQELAKINRIIDREAEGCAKECLLVLDATTGQNAVNQARLFQEVAPITGIVLTKLDGTAKGGIVISIKNELNIPVKLIGVGEGIDDLQPFEARSFIDALFERDMDSAENTEKFNDTVDEVSEDMIENVDEVFDDEATEEIVEIVEDDVENAVETVEEDAEVAETVADISADTVEMVGNTVESVNEAAELESEGIPLSEWLPEEERLPVDERIPPEEGMLPLISYEKKDAEPSDTDESTEQPEKKKKGFFSFFKRKK